MHSNKSSTTYILKDLTFDAASDAVVEAALNARHGGVLQGVEKPLVANVPNADLQRMSFVDFFLLHHFFPAVRNFGERRAPF